MYYAWVTCWYFRGGGFCPPFVHVERGGVCKMSTLVHFRGGGVKNGQNLVHVVVECPLMCPAVAVIALFPPTIHFAPSILCRLKCWMVNLTNSLIFSICLMFTKSLWEWSPMHQKLTGQCTMRVSDFWIYPIYHMKLVFSTTFTQMVQHTILKLISNSVNLQAVWFHITLFYGSFLFLYPLIFKKDSTPFFQKFRHFHFSYLKFENQTTVPMLVDNNFQRDG
jgi:hypothetical protein